MKYVKSFENYQQTNEGWKENLLAGLLTLVGSYAYGQNQPDRIIRKAKTEKQVQDLLKLGYTLDSTQVDTVWKEITTKAPDSQVMAIRYSLAGDQYFQSGKFDLTNEMSDCLDEILNEIMVDGGILTNIDIESSTDKQPIGKNLQDKLKSLGYTTDNDGLSKARCESIENYLTKNRVDSTLINTIQKSELGKDVVDPSARYVNVDFYYVIPSAVLPSESEKDVQRVKTIYYLSKEKEPTKVVTLKRKNIKVKELGKVKNTGSRLPIECPTWGD